MILAHEPESSAAAREFVRKAAADWLIDFNDLLTVVGELVGNAVVHTRGESIVVRAYELPAWYVVEVWDYSPRMPEPRTPDLAWESGRGLVVVAELAGEWGVRRLPAGGKAVFARWAR
ncbi:ATP-binding protein [Actinomadura graeca]|uniref:ATP-binding protein n=1 Tax=Actinomadura graeca TaxID=2750812 RepID=A0ABX8QSE3_9ACTN|nr:ATP-binding protein [Actinomadura graeca]QXJ19718.1 ATP-binding protein [Actinomadura graeca]